MKKLRLLGRYVEVTCKNDMAIFMSSGFEPASGSRAQPQGFSQNIRSLDHGANRGEITVRLKAIANASSYELRYAAAGDDNGGTVLTWTTEAVTGVKTPVTLTGLKPATTYAFQVRSLGKSGYSEWSDSVTFIQRYGDALNCNLHFHCLVIDGVYASGEDGRPEFHELPAPEDEDVIRLTTLVSQKIQSLLKRRGFGTEEAEREWNVDVAEPDRDRGTRQGSSRGKCDI